MTPNPSIERQTKACFAAFGLPLMSNVRPLLLAGRASSWLALACASSTVKRERRSLVPREPAVARTVFAGCPSFGGQLTARFARTGGSCGASCVRSSSRRRSPARSRVETHVSSSVCAPALEAAASHAAVLLFRQWPNPSIERTFQRPLRALCAAAHVER